MQTFGFQPHPKVVQTKHPTMGFMITNVYIITAIAVIGGALFGFDISSMSAILGTQAYKCYFNQGPHGEPECSGPTPNVQGGITAAMPGGSLVGALLSGILSDRMGRKYSIQVGALIWCTGSIVAATSQNIGMLIAGRFINGVSVGICSAQVPVYVSELSPAAKRGRLVATQQWAITWGILIMYFISYACSFAKGTAAFRIPWGLQTTPAVLLFVGLLFTPESPRFLAKQDLWEECQGILAKIHAKGDLESPLVLRELQEIKDACDFERQTMDVSYLELFKPKMLRRTHIGVFTQIWSQLTGMSAMMYYVTYIYGMAGLKGNVNLYSSSIQYVVNMLMTIPAIIWMDRWGRRRTLMTGSICMMVCMFANGGVLATYGKPAPPGGVDNVAQESWQISAAASRFSIACTLLFVSAFACSIGPVSWVYPPELFPLRVRAKATALSTASNWLFNGILSWVVPPAFVSIQWKVYIVFGVFLATMTVHFFFMFPETAGKTLEVVDEMFLANVRPWNTKVWTRSDLDASSQIIAEQTAKEVHSNFSDLEKAADVVEKQKP